MKVGLVPLLYDEYNYGGVLQFYALQKVLNNNNIECDIIFFENNEIISQCELKGTEKILFWVKTIVSKILCRKANAILDEKMFSRKKKIDQFKKKHYSQTLNANNISYKDYDAIICGSDQIWNPGWARRRAFLEFVPDDTKKIIYAASLGCESLNDKQKEQFKWRIERLQSVSVREESGKTILDEFIENMEIKVVLDPTLLLLPSEWLEIIKQPKAKNYIFTYFLGKYDDKIDYIRNFANKHNLKIVNIPFASGEKNDEVEFGDIKITDADPGDFIGLIKNAEYIFTDSFHACVFSVLFKKEFFAFQRDNNNRMQGRINTLLHNFKLPDRFINTETNLEYMKLNYEMNDKLQRELRKDSLDFLLGSIND